MPQISLYVDEPALRKVETAALREHVSISKWVAEQIRTRVDPVFSSDSKRDSLLGIFVDTNTCVYFLNGKYESIKDKILSTPPNGILTHSKSFLLPI